MSYTKPYIYVDGAVLQNIGQQANEESLKMFVNQEILTTDLDTNSFTGDNIAQYRFISPVYSIDFITKQVQAKNRLRKTIDYNYFSSTTKLGNQTNANVQDFQTLPETAVEVIVDPEAPQGFAEVLWTCYVKAFAGNNSNVAKGQGNGLWENKFILQIENANGNISRYDGVRQFVFEGAGTPLGTLDPADEGDSARHRSLMFSRKFQLTAGRWRLSLAVDPKVERGNINSQGTFVETFYI